MMQSVLSPKPVEDDLHMTSILPNIIMRRRKKKSKDHQWKMLNKLKNRAGRRKRRNLINLKFLIGLSEEGLTRQRYLIVKRVCSSINLSLAGLKKCYKRYYRYLTICKWKAEINSYLIWWTNFHLIKIKVLKIASLKISKDLMVPVAYIHIAVSIELWF